MRTRAHAACAVAACVCAAGFARGEDAGPQGRPLRDSAAVRAVVLSPDGRRLAGALPDGSIGIWNVGSGALERTLAGGPRPSAAALSSDGSTLATAADDGTIALRDVSTGASRGSFGTGVVNRDDIGAPVRLFLWDLASGTPGEPTARPTLAFTFLPNGRGLAIQRAESGSLEAFTLP